MSEINPDETVIDGTPQVRLGDRVIYTNNKGHEKLAFVTGTQETVKVSAEVSDGEEDEDGYLSSDSLPAVEDGRAHLTVFSPSGRVYPRLNIPQGAGPNTFALIV